MTSLFRRLASAVPSRSSLTPVSPLATRSFITRPSQFLSSIRPSTPASHTHSPNCGCPSHALASVFTHASNHGLAFTRGMKVRSSIKRLCDGCQFVRRSGKLWVICKKDQKHKTRQGWTAKRKK